MPSRVKFFFLLFVICFLGVSCARIMDMTDRPPKPDAALFESAERKFAASEYDEALSLYEQYLEEYPDKPLVPAALLKTGLIRLETERYEAAREIFGKVIREHPESGFARWAKVETLYAHFLEKDFDAAAEYAETLDAEEFPQDMALRIHLIAGDAWMEHQVWDRAFDRFLEAFAIAPETRRMNAGERLAGAAARLDPDELEKAIDAYEDREEAVYLVYAKGLRLAEDGRVGDAAAHFNDFARRFSEHPMAARALEKIEEIEEMAYFKGHRIGLLLPLSGEYAKFGMSILQGVEAAMIRFSENRNLDPPLEIIVRDTGDDPEQAVEGVKYLAEEKVAAIAGPIVMADAAAREAQMRGVPIITLTQRPDVTETGDYVFRNFLTSRMQAEVLAKYATGRLGLERFAILYPDEQYGEVFLHAFWDKLIEHGGVVKGVESYDSSKTDFSRPIRKLVGLYHDIPDDLRGVVPVEGQLFEADGDLYDGDEPGLVRAVAEDEQDDNGEPKAIVDFDAVFIPDSARVSGLIIPQLRFYDISDVHLLGSNLWHSQALIDTAGRQLRQVVIPEGFYADSSRPGVSRFVRDYEQVYGEAPGYLEAAGYDTAMILFELVSKPAIDNRVALKNALLDMPPMEGMTGTTHFDETGDAVKDLYLLEVVRGQFSEIRE